MFCVLSVKEIQMLKLKHLDRALEYQATAENTAWKLINGVHLTVPKQLSVVLKKSVPAMRIVKKKTKKPSE